MCCPLYAGEDEDCPHLFFTCPIVQEAWRAAGVARLVVSSCKAFWSSLIDGSFRREQDWRRAFATLWAIWIHRNEVIFWGVTLSSDAIIHVAYPPVCHFLDKRRFRPLAHRAPVTIDLYPCVIISMTLGGTIFGVPLPLFKKKKKLAIGDIYKK